MLITNTQSTHTVGRPLGLTNIHTHTLQTLQRSFGIGYRAKKDLWQYNHKEILTHNPTCKDKGMPLCMCKIHIYKIHKYLDMWVTWHYRWNVKLAEIINQQNMYNTATKTTRTANKIHRDNTKMKDKKVKETTTSYLQHTCHTLTPPLPSLDNIRLLHLWNEETTPHMSVNINNNNNKNQGTVT